MPESQSNSNSSSTRWAAALAVTYFFALAAAFLWTYLPRYFVGIGWTSTAIGMVLGVATIVRVVAMPLWARIAERTSSTTRVIQVVTTIGAMTLWVLPFVESTWAVYLLFALLYGTWNSFHPLLDSLTVRQLGSGSFGRIRGFGSAGFGVMALTLAFAAAHEEHAVVSGWAPWFIAVLGTPAAISVWFFPRDEVAIRAPDLPHALRLLRRPALMWCMILWAAHWASQAPYNLFFVFLAEQREMAGWVPGAAIATGVLAEVAVLWTGRRMVERIGPEAVFAASAFMTAARWALCSVLTNDVALVAVQLVHGITFGAFLLSAMAILDREVRPEVRDSGQAIFYVLVFGAGSAIGNAASGWLNDVLGAADVFAVAAGLELMVGLFGAIYAVSVVRGLANKR